MAKKVINEALVAVIAEYAEDVHLTYSGRGMYGETCYAFSGCVPRIIGMVISDICDIPELLQQFGEMLFVSRQDSMGLGTVIYFPGWDIIADNDKKEEI